MNMIVAVDENWGIGRDNELLVRIPNDQKFFRQETLGKVVILGRKTMEAFPGGKPLRDRKNIILSGNRTFTCPGATVVHNVDELLDECKKYKEEDLYVIGGASVYEQLLPYCSVAHVTKIDRVYDADTYCPNLDENPEWEITESSDEQVYFDLTYHFIKYERK